MKFDGEEFTELLVTSTAHVILRTADVAAVVKDLAGRFDCEEDAALVELVKTGVAIGLGGHLPGYIQASGVQQIVEIESGKILFQNEVLGPAEGGENGG